MISKVKMTIELELEKMAIKKRISGKAQSIAQKLGKTIADTHEDNIISKHWEYGGGKLHIGYRRAYRFDIANKTIGKDLKVDISYEGNNVFNENTIEITSYKPGDWEEELEKLYKMAKSGSP